MVNNSGFWIITRILSFLPTKCEHVPYKIPNGFALYLEIVISSVEHVNH